MELEYFEGYTFFLKAFGFSMPALTNLKTVNAAFILPLGGLYNAKYILATSTTRVT